MEAYLAWLEGGRVLNIVSLVLGLGGIYFSIYFYLKSVREKKPAYWPNSYLLLKKTIGQVDGLEVLYEKHPIPSLSVTRVAFWNAGREIIRRSDIASNDPIVIYPETSTMILDAKISFQKRMANQISIDLKGDQVALDFEYFGFHDGCIINVYHTDEANFFMRGTIIGAEGIRCAKGNYPPKPPSRVDKMFESALNSKIPGASIVLVALFLIPAIVMLPILLLVEKARQPVGSMPREYSDK